MESGWILRGEKVISLSVREKKIIILTTLVVTVAAFINLLSWILTGRSSSNVDILDRYKKLYDKFSYQSQLAKDYAPLLEKYKDVLATKLSHEDASTALFSTVKSIVQKQGSVIERIKPRQVKSEGNYQEIAFEIELIGTFAQVFKIINSLETHSELINVNSLKIIPFSKESDSIRCILVISRPFF